MYERRGGREGETIKPTRRCILTNEHIGVVNAVLVENDTAETFIEVGQLARCVERNAATIFNLNG